MSDIFKKFSRDPLGLSDGESKELCDVIKAHLLDFAFYISLDNESPFRSRAYGKAASSLDLYTCELPGLIQENALETIAGIGPSIAAEVQSFIKTGGYSPELERMRQGHPAVIRDLMQALDLRESLARAYRAYAFQDSLELFFLLQSGFYFMRSQLDGSQNQRMLRGLMKNLASSPHESSEGRLETHGKIHGLGAWLFWKAQELEEGQRSYLQSLSYLLHTSSPGFCSERQMEIRMEFEQGRFETLNEFLKACSGPLVNAFACPGFFSADLRLSPETLDCWENERKTLVLPLHPSLENSVKSLIAQTQERNLGLFFAIFTPDLDFSPEDLLEKWIDGFKLSKRQILNFAPAEAMRTYLTAQT